MKSRGILTFLDETITGDMGWGEVRGDEKGLAKKPETDGEVVG